MSLAVAVALLACSGSADPKPDPTLFTGEDPPTTPTEVPTTPEPDPTPTGGTTTAPVDCAVDPALEVLEVTTTMGTFSTLVEVGVTLSAEAAVAVQCTSDEDPEEVFFAESGEPATTHAVRLSGLIPRTSYSCSAAPVCPESAGPATPFTWTTEEAPSDLRALTVEIDPKLGMQGAWTLAPYSSSAFFGATWLVVWGPDGRPRWWWRTPVGVGVWIEARYHPDEGDFVWGGGFASEGRMRAVDPWEGETYAWAPADWQSTEFHHDGKRIADGRLMSLEIRENSEGFATWDGFGIRIHDPATGVVDFDFDSQTLVDAGQLRTAGGFFDTDPYHANWMDWQQTANGEEVYVSLCFARQILAIDVASGELAWQLGEGLGWTVLDETGAELGEEALPQCQHGLEVAGDLVLVYDNGQDRPRSSASEWRIDPVAMTATRLWYWDEAGWTEDYLGDIDWLPNDRVLVTEASSFGVADLVEVDRATGAVASRMTFDDGGYTYRADRYEGCDLFTSTRACDTLKARYDEVSALLAP